LIVVDVSDQGVENYAAFIHAFNKDSFLLERSVNGGAFETLATIQGKDYYLDTKVRPENRYAYKVKNLEGVVSFRPLGNDSVPPVITDINVHILNIAENKAEVLISWQTDKLSDSQAEIDNQIFQDDNPNHSHKIIVDNLRLNHTYTYKVKSKTEEGLSSVSEDKTFYIPARSEKKNTLQLILQILKSQFNFLISWLKV